MNSVIELLWRDEILIRLQDIGALVGWITACQLCAAAAAGGGGGERRGLRYVVVPVGVCEFPILNDKRDVFLS